MRRQLLLATTNGGKLREMRRILEGVPVELKTLDAFPDIQIADETGATFAENARQKALHYAALTGMWTMAEDSGFEVDALGGEPGIYSARYLGDDATYPERFAAIWAGVAASGNPDRSARFMCAVAVANGSEITFETLASVEGELAPAAAGPNGFGYDPIFYYPPFGKTFGEVSDERKNSVSARGQAMRKLREFLHRTQRT